MKLKCDDTIRAEVATYIGTLTWIDWENNVGKALLDAPPGADPNAEPVEVDCTFRYMGQHWIWNMDAYPDEDAASHSAFAFCIGDRVMLLHKDKKAEPGQTPPQPPEKEYVGVAVLKEEDDGNGGKKTSIWKRKVWPLYRIGHESLVLDFKYAGLDDKGAGFPFLSHVRVGGYPAGVYAYYYDGRRELQNPFVDQQGHERAFGTPKRDDGWGNPRLVVTKEKDENDETVFVPHAVHEFAEGNENMPYVPDVLMQTKPNWRGRTIGWSAHDEILIDNIPVARVAPQSVEAILPSWKAATKKIIHIDEAHNTLTVLFVTVDCNYDWRPYDNSGAVVNNGANNWYPPKYAFYVQRGGISELCPYAAMDTPRNELPVIEMQPDLEASWLWRDLRAIRPTIYMQNNRLDNLSDGFGIAAPGQEIEVFFWAGLVMMGLYVPNESDKRRKIGLTISTAADGSISITKKVGDPEPFAPIDKNRLDSHLTYEPPGKPRPNFNTGTIADGYHTKTIYEDFAETKQIVREEAARLGDAVLWVELSGKDNYSRDRDTDREDYETNLVKAYRHDGPEGHFVIAEERQILSGYADDAANTVRATISMIVFTHIDLRHGIYGYWDVTWFDDVEAKYFSPDVSSRPPSPYYIKWEHYVRSASGRARTHAYEFEMPFCLHGPYTAAQIGSGSGSGSVMDDEYARMQTIRLLSWFLNQGALVDKGYLHNVWDFPRLFENGEEKNVAEMQYRFPFSLDSFTYAPVNFISEFLMMTAPNRGSRRASATLKYETTFNGFVTAPSDDPSHYRPYAFDLHPLPSKEPGVWPYFRNCCLETGGDYLQYASEFWNEPGVNGILFSESMEFEGAVFGFGEFAYNVRLKKEGEAAVRAASPGMEKLLRCTGRDDAIIGVD